MSFNDQSQTEIYEQCQSYKKRLSELILRIEAEGYIETSVINKDLQWIGIDSGFSSYHPLLKTMVYKGVFNSGDDKTAAFWLKNDEFSRYYVLPSMIDDCTIAWWLRHIEIGHALFGGCPTKAIHWAAKDALVKSEAANGNGTTPSSANEESLRLNDQDAARFVKLVGREQVEKLAGLRRPVMVSLAESDNARLRDLLDTCRAFIQEEFETAYEGEEMAHSGQLCRAFEIIQQIKTVLDPAYTCDPTASELATYDWVRSLPHAKPVESSKAGTRTIWIERASDYGDHDEFSFFAIFNGKEIEYIQFHMAELWAPKTKPEFLQTMRMCGIDPKGWSPPTASPSPSTEIES